VQKKLEIAYQTRNTTVNLVTKIRSYSQSNSVVSIVADAIHNVYNNQQVILSGVSNSLDYVLLTTSNVNSGENTFTVTAPYSANVNSTVVADGGIYNYSQVGLSSQSNKVISYRQTNAVMTLTLANRPNIAPYTTAAGNSVRFFGVTANTDGTTYSVAAVNNAANTINVVVGYSANITPTAITNGSAGLYNITTGSGGTNVSGNLVYVTTRTPHGLKTGDSVLIEGLTSSVDGVHRVTETASTSRFVILIASNALETTKSISTASRLAGSNIVTVVTSTDHGFLVGDAIYVDGTDQSTFNGDQVVFSVLAGGKSFSYASSGNTAVNANVTNSVVGRYPNVYATQEFPIVSVPNNTSITYYTKYADTINTTSLTSISNTAGEVVKNSDGTVRVYFKSGWIG
jgi:hypothetical protein